MFYKKREYGMWLYAVVAAVIISFVILPPELKNIPLCAALMIFGGALLEKPLWLLFNSRRIRREWVTVSAPIIRSEYAPKQRYFHIEMEITNAEGVRLPFVRRSWCWLMPVPRVGKMMTVHYDPSKPADFLLKPEYILITVLYVMLASAAVAAGVLLLILTFRGIG